MSKYCLICGNDAVDETYGYTWCERHKKFNKIGPEALEQVRLWRLEGRPTEYMEKKLKLLLDFYS